MSAVPSDGRRYEVLATLGKGGFGTVYKARLLGEGGFSKQVALKVLNPDIEKMEEIAARMRDEARILGLIRHRAIVQVDGLVKLNGQWTVVMEYIEGVDLSTLIGAGPVPPGPALEITAEVAGALHVAYNAPGPNGQPLRLLHRDIKPPNLQVTTAGEVKVLDFGVARADFEGREAQTKSLRFGSVGYMSPERMDGEDGPGGDIYAIGLVLFELIAGEAFGPTYMNRKRHDENVAQRLALVRQRVPRPHGDAVARFLGEVLAYDANRRPSPRDIERRCAELRADVRGELLRDYAERVVPTLLAQRSSDGEGLTGFVLTEGSSPLKQPLPQPADKPKAKAQGTSWQSSAVGAKAAPAPASVPAAASSPVKRPTAAPAPTKPTSRTGLFVGGGVLAALVVLGGLAIVAVIVVAIVLSMHG